MGRKQSPSSINLFKQCPRRYYYQYILKLDTLPSIHLIRGSIAHSVLEHFFDIDIQGLDKTNFEKPMKTKLQELFISHWHKQEKQLNSLKLSSDQMKFYFTETMMMLLNWFEKLSAKVFAHKEDDFAKVFAELTPEREKKYDSEKLYVRGFIDAIEKVEGEIRLMDYKTSKRFKMSEAYRLQLAIYAVLYWETHGVLPNQVGIYFLKDTGKHEYLIDVDEQLLEWARMEIKLIHLKTRSTEKADYPKNITPLCKWSTGQCDFYDRCIKE